MSFFAEYGSELVHNAAVYAAIVMFCSLTYFCQFELVYLVVSEQVIQCVSKCRFKCGG